MPNSAVLPDDAFQAGEQLARTEICFEFDSQYFASKTQNNNNRKIKKKTREIMVH